MLDTCASHFTMLDTCASHFTMLDTCAVILTCWIHVQSNETFLSSSQILGECLNSPNHEEALILDFTSMLDASGSGL
jgi:hypothetical protein